MDMIPNVTCPRAHREWARRDQCRARRPRGDRVQLRHAGQNRQCGSQPQSVGRDSARFAHADADAASRRHRRAGCLRDGMWRQRGRGAQRQAERRNTRKLCEGRKLEPRVREARTLFSKPRKKRGARQTGSLAAACWRVWAWGWEAGPSIGRSELQAHHALSAIGPLHLLHGIASKGRVTKNGQARPTRLARWLSPQNEQGCQLAASRRGSRRGWGGFGVPDPCSLRDFGTCPVTDFLLPVLDPFPATTVDGWEQGRYRTYVRTEFHDARCDDYPGQTLAPNPFPATDLDPASIHAKVGAHPSSIEGPPPG